MNDSPRTKRNLEFSDSGGRLAMAAATGLLLCLPASRLAVAQQAGTAAGESTAEAEVEVTRASINFLPGQRRAFAVRADERNPFADRVPEMKPREVENEGETEDDRLRVIFSELNVSGISRGPRGLRVLMGDLILEKGRAVPPLLENQTARLMVTDVSENELEVNWLNRETGEVTQKKLLIAYDLSPTVGFVLQGQGAGGEGGARKVRFGKIRRGAAGEPDFVNTEPVKEPLERTRVRLFDEAVAETQAEPVTE